MNKTITAFVVCAVLASGCATHRIDPVAANPAPESEPQQATNPKVLQVVKGTGAGALAGAVVCALPTIAGAQSRSPIVFFVGGLLTIVCLPYGLAIGAVAGTVAGGAKAAFSRSPHADSPASAARVDSEPNL